MHSDFSDYSAQINVRICQLLFILHLIVKLLGYFQFSTLTKSFYGHNVHCKDIRLEAHGECVFYMVKVPSHFSKWLDNIIPHPPHAQ